MIYRHTQDKYYTDGWKECILVLIVIQEALCYWVLLAEICTLGHNTIDAEKTGCILQTLRQLLVSDTYIIYINLSNLHPVVQNVSHTLCTDTFVTRCTGKVGVLVGQAHVLRV